MVGIPKIFHQIWLGGDMPYLFKKYQKSWIKFNPGWRLKVWNEANINQLKHLNKDVLDALPNFVQKSDYLRIIILLEFGGVYIDTDFECYKNIDPLLQDCNFGIGEQFYNEYPNAFIAAMPHHPVLKLMAEKILLQSKKIYMVSEDKTGPRFISKIINQNKGKNMKIIPGFLLYPEYWLHIIKARKNKSKIFASHHYHPIPSKKITIYVKAMIVKQAISQYNIGRCLIIILHITIRIFRRIEYIILNAIYKLIKQR